VKSEKLRTQVSKVTTLMQPNSIYWHGSRRRRAVDAPASEGICALEIQLDAFFHEALAVAPLVYSVFEMGVQDLHGCNAAVTGKRMRGISGENLPSVMRMHPSGYALYASCGRDQ
jgi:hypothetical protein